MSLRHIYDAATDQILVWFEDGRAALYTLAGDIAPSTPTAAPSPTVGTAPVAADAQAPLASPPANAGGTAPAFNPAAVTQPPQGTPPSPLDPSLAGTGVS